MVAYAIIGLSRPCTSKSEMLAAFPRNSVSRRKLIRQRLSTTCSQGQSERGWGKSEKQSKWSLEQRQGHRWVEGLRWSRRLPHIDWTRYNMQVLFVDERHEFRGRIAEGLCARIADWNGYGRSLCPQSCGMEAVEGAFLPFQAAATMLGEGHRLKISSHVLKQPSAQFSSDLLDHFDLILAMDEQMVEAMLEGYEGEEREYYARKVFLLSSFATYPSTAQLTQTGGLALLESELRECVALELETLRNSIKPSIANVQPNEDFNNWLTMTNHIIISVAGLVAYLIDANPDDLEEQWLD